MVASREVETCQGWRSRNPRERRQSRVFEKKGKAQEREGEAAERQGGESEEESKGQRGTRRGDSRYK